MTEGTHELLVEVIQYHNLTDVIQANGNFEGFCRCGWIGSKFAHPVHVADTYESLVTAVRGLNMEMPPREFYDELQRYLEWAFMDCQQRGHNRAIRDRFRAASSACERAGEAP